MTLKQGKVMQVDVRRAWPNESAPFTPRLASALGLELVQNALGMDLQVEAIEQFIGPVFGADILTKRTDMLDWVEMETPFKVVSSWA